MLRLLFVVSCFAAAAAFNSYLITAPNTIRPGLPLMLHVSILNASSPVVVEARVTEDKDNTSIIATGLSKFYTGSPGTLKIQIPDSLNADSWARYRLWVWGSGGLTFQNDTAITYRNKGLSIFIQTDKGIYKAGQTVKYRVFATYPDLKPYLEPLDVTVSDTNGNIIQMLSDQRPPTGVVTSSLELPDQPVLGHWTIQVTAQSQKQSARFEVGEFVLPKFEVKVNLPSYALMNDSAVTGSVEAKYTFGKGVVGKATLSIRVDPFYRWGKTQQKIEKTFELDGKHEFTLTNAELRSLLAWETTTLNRKRLVVTANVTETLTGVSLQGEAQVEFFEYRAKLQALPSNPTSFKPGLKYNAVMQLLQQDGTPMAAGQHNVTIRKIYTWNEKDESESVFGRYQSMVSQCSFTETAVNETATADENGNILLSTDVPLQVERMQIQVYYESNERISRTMWVSRMNSPTNSFIQVTPVTEGSVQAGSFMSFEVKSTQPLSRVYYQVISRGTVVASDDVPVSNSASRVLFSLRLQPKMAPSSKLVVYYVRGDGEVVNDAISFNVDGVFRNKVNLTMSRERAEPGETVDVTVTADEGSYVGLGAVDQSSLLLRSANDVTPQKVIDEISQFDTGNRPVYLYRWYPVPITGQDAKTVFSNAGLLHLSDTLIEYWSRQSSRGEFGSTGTRGVSSRAGMPAPQGDRGESEADMAGERGRAGAAGPMADGANEASKTPLQEPTRVRTEFPETWIWTDMSVSASGSVSLASQVPDTITSWVASAFALSLDSGLGVVDAPSKLEVFRQFFVSLSLPFSVVRGEQVVLQAVVFNYLDQDLETLVTLEASEDFEVTVKDVGSGNIVTEAGRDAVVTVTVPAGKGHTVLFPITPTKLGGVTLKVKAQAALAADAVEKTLRVEAEGVEQDYTESFLLTLEEGEPEALSVPITFPPSLVPGSGRVTVSAIGDVMGPTVNNLDRLLKMPYGCGEQNMINFVPNILVAQYLSGTNQLDDAVRSKAVRFMNKGYQRELTYQRADGSFSAFGNRDRSGSTWLTAFVMKSFEQARPYIFVSDKTLEKAFNWLVEQQEENGEFKEPGQVLSQSLQGGGSSSDTLTAYVLISLLEMRESPADLPELESSISNAVRYLESHVQNTTDLYPMSVMHYALTLAASPMAETLRGRLAALARDEDGMMYWGKPENLTPTDAPRYWRPRHVTAKAINIEMTAYNLLATVEREDMDGGAPILRWLTKQRNGQGGFVSTQDTIMALQALGEFAALVYRPDRSVTVSITSGSESHSFNINNDNALVLQSYYPNTAPTEVSMETVGTGVVLLQVEVDYNVIEVPQEPAFDIATRITAENVNFVEVEVCISYTRGEATGMAVVEHGIPSGFEVDKAGLERTEGVKRVEVQDRKAILYFDSFTNETTCYVAKQTRVDIVAKSQPSPVKVYDYYFPDQQHTVYYSARSLETTKLCDVCKDCKDVCV